MSVCSRGANIRWTQTDKELIYISILLSLGYTIYHALLHMRVACCVQRLARMLLEKRLLCLLKSIGILVGSLGNLMKGNS